MDSIRNREASTSAAPLNLNLDLNIDLTNSDHHHHYPVIHDHGEEEEEEHDDDDNDVDGYLAEELSRMNAEHEKLLHNLTLISKHLLNLLNLMQDQGSFKKPRDSRTVNNKIYRQIHPCDTTLIVKDGYQWRKYGQKVTRDNPSPRAYYKCSFAPNCPVKKKVQKSLHDPSLLIAIYQGEHNHPPPAENEVQLDSNLKNAQRLIPEMSPNFSSSDFKLPLDKFFIDHMASSLVHNSNFTTSLATTIFEKLLGNELFE